jgi:hypothetical protein
LIALVAAGNKQEAVTQLMSQTGYDEAEARELIKTMGGLRIGGASCGAGCLRMIVGLILLAALAFMVLRQLGNP